MLLPTYFSEIGKLFYYNHGYKDLYSGTKIFMFTVIMIYAHDLNQITRRFRSTFFRDNFVPLATGNLCIRERNKITSRFCASVSALDNHDKHCFLTRLGEFLRKPCLNT